MLGDCETCGQPIPEWADIAGALEEIIGNSTMVGLRPMVRQAVREIRELRQAEIRLRDEKCELHESNMRLRQQLRDAIGPARPVVEVHDIADPQCHVVKQVVAVYYAGQNHWRVEIR